MPEIFCEPGRAIVAESGSTIVKILLKKKKLSIRLFKVTIFQITQIFQLRQIFLNRILIWRVFI